MCDWNRNSLPLFGGRSKLYHPCSIPNDFLSERIGDLNTCIRMLESEITTQESINSVYSEFPHTIISEMIEKLSLKKFTRQVTIIINTCIFIIDF